MNNNNETKLAKNLINALSRNDIAQLNAYRVVFGQSKLEELMSRGLNVRAGPSGTTTAGGKRKKTGGGAGPSGVKKTTTTTAGGKRKKTSTGGGSSGAGPSGVQKTNNNECPVCMNTNVTTTAKKCKVCKHAICKSCLGKIKNINVLPKCPLCRGYYH